jgi:hypothetical protein
VPITAPALSQPTTAGLPSCVRCLQPIDLSYGRASI